MKFHAFLVVLITCLLTTGCGLLNSEDDDNDEILEELLPPEKELIPLEVGNYWVHEQWYRDPTWKVTVREEVLNVQTIIAEGTKIQAYGSYRFHYKEEPREDPLIPLRANGPEGYYALGFNIPTDSLYNLKEGLYFKYPATVGDNWEHTTVSYNSRNEEMTMGSTRTIELVDTTRTVETSMGTFTNCYVYKYNDFGPASTLVHYFYIKPMVGVVGVDTYVADDKKTNMVKNEF